LLEIDLDAQTRNDRRANTVSVALTIGDLFLAGVNNLQIRIMCNNGGRGLAALGARMVSCRSLPNHKLMPYNKNETEMFSERSVNHGWRNIKRNSQLLRPYGVKSAGRGEH
jgi:hypothetical protein